MNVNAYTFDSDIFSFGVILFEIIVRGDSLWFDVEKEETVRNMIKTGNRPKIPVDCEDYYSESIEECWKQVIINNTNIFEIETT